MALKIIKASLSSQSKPEPIYQARLRSILRPLHPLFVFNITQMDTQKTIDFDISLHASPEKGFLPGTFAGFWFNRTQANDHDYSISGQMKRFEQYVFKCLARFISDVVSRGSLGPRQNMVVYDGKIDAKAIGRHTAYLAEGFDIFTPYSGQKEGLLHLILDPKEYRHPGTGRPVTPINVGGFNLDELEQSLHGFSREAGAAAANQRLKQYLLNLFTDALYNSRFDLGGGDE